ncbi:TPA: DUF1488 domain-containing protein [Escherichia coli]|nr:transcriptional regulator [Escherichia coli]HAI2351124.1 DUF1488 domain-containing protein [Escherichia coli]
MNQAIQFPDREEWDENKKCVCFPALVNGMQLTCAISGDSLAYRFTGDTPEQWLASFRQHRWDLERNKVKMIKVGSGYPDPGIRLSISRNYSRNNVTQPSLHHLTGGSV